MVTVVAMVVAGAGSVAVLLFRRRFADRAAKRWGLAEGERLSEMFTVARAVEPLPRGQATLMTAAAVVGVFAGFRVGQTIERMTMVVTDRRTMLALAHGNAKGARVEFDGARPVTFTVHDTNPGFRPDGLHEAAVVTVHGEHLQEDLALVVPARFLEAPPAYVRVTPSTTPT
jgi:xanthine/CO dehydrogenase XdhC/CoxF family maturation factor